MSDPDARLDCSDMAGETTQDRLEARVRETPLMERLQECQRRIGNMCSEGRPPRMCIPVQYDDDDFYICTTLRDAADALQQARAEGLREVMDECERLGEGYTLDDVWGCGNEGDVAKAGANDAYRYVAKWCREKIEARAREGG